jgi:hypothetical protein
MAEAGECESVDGKDGGMKKLFLTGAILAGIATLGTMYLLMRQANAQNIEISPGGVYINPEHRNWGRECAELRQLCEEREPYEGRGEGNCRRYRELCRR